MKSKLTTILTASFLFLACEPKDGDDGTNGKDGLNGTDGVSCAAIQDEGEDAILCGETIIPVIHGEDGEDGEKGANGEDGEDGLSCQLAEKEDQTYVVCGDESYLLPSNDPSEVDSCEASKLESGNWLITCGDESFEVPSEESIAGYIVLALSPVEAPELSVQTANGLTATLNFEIPVELDKEALKLLPEGYKLSRLSSNSFELKSADLFEGFPFTSELTTWSETLPAGLFLNKLNPAQVLQDTVELAVTSYDYVIDFETLTFDRDDSNICEAEFSPLAFEEVKKLKTAQKPVLLSVAEKKAFNVTTQKVVSVEPTSEVQISCMR